MGNFLLYNGYRFAWTAILFLLFVAVRYLVLRKHRAGLGKGHELRVLLLAAWVSLVLGLTLAPYFSFYPDGHVALTSGMAYQSVNFTPFRVFSDSIEQMNRNNISYMLFNILGNFLLFLPIGLLLPMVGSHFQKLRVTLPVCLLFSLGIESTQYCLFRGADIDDLWLETLGALFGFSLFLLTHKRSKKTGGVPSAA